MAVLSSGPMFVSFGQDGEAVLKLYQEAKAAEGRADYPAATHRYEKIVALRPDLAEAHANLGNLYYVQGKYDQAQRSFGKAAKLKPQLAGPHFFLGVLAFRSRDWPSAIGRLGKAAELDPANPLVQLQLGFTYYATGEYQKAIAHLETVAKQDNQNEDAWYHLSKLYGQMSRRYFDRLQVKWPDAYQTHLARAHFFEGQSNWTDAATEYEKAQAKNGAIDVSARVQELRNRGQGNESAWKPVSEEIDGSTRFLHQPPNVADSLAEFWQLQAKVAGSNPDASTPEQLYTFAERYQLMSYLSATWLIGRNSDSYRAHQLKGQSLEAAGRNEEAVTEYRAALEKKSDLQTVHFAIGNIYWRGGQLEPALSELKKELEVNPNDPQAHYEIGDILFTQGDLETATTHYMKCLQFAPDTVEAHLALDRIYTGKGQNQQALQHLLKAAAIAPKDPTPHYRLWLLYRKLGKTAEAESERKMFEQLRKTAKPAAEQ
jgi:tetratricopeptide (TPR) repeat protein